MFEGLTEAQIESRVRELHGERLRLVSDLKKMQNTVANLNAEVMNKSRVYEQYLSGFKKLKKAHVISMDTYRQVRKTLNDIVDDTAPKQAEEEKVRNEVAKQRERIAGVDRALEGAEEAIGKACKVYYGRFGAGSEAP